MLLLVTWHLQSCNIHSRPRALFIISNYNISSTPFLHQIGTVVHSHAQLLRAPTTNYFILVEVYAASICNKNNICQQLVMKEYGKLWQSLQYRLFLFKSIQCYRRCIVSIERNFHRYRCGISRSAVYFEGHHRR